MFVAVVVVFKPSKATSADSDKTIPLPIKTSLIPPMSKRMPPTPETEVIASCVHAICKPPALSLWSGTT